MCGRYAIVTKVKAIEKRFEVVASPEFKFNLNVNVSLGNMAPVITDANPDELQLFQFGFTPDWSKKQSYVINARSEGDFNRENDDRFTGKMGIARKPMFRKSIRSRRCLVVSDCFVEGSDKEKLNRPYLVYLKDGTRPFAFAGIWDEWVSTSIGEVVKSFAIITTVSNSVTKKIGHQRSPVILSPEDEKLWLTKDAPFDEVLNLLQPYPGELMNAYPISKEIKSPSANGVDLLQPIGQRVNKEYVYEVYDEIKLKGMGETKARERKNSEGQQGTLF
ncbi:MAG: SOS response-associated peptidase [Flavobacteriales bacterium]|nr:SOS response-associated peptidase [Flavobacteriales bacterium]